MTRLVYINKAFWQLIDVKTCEDLYVAFVLRVYSEAEVGKRNSLCQIGGRSKDARPQESEYNVHYAKHHQDPGNLEMFSVLR